MTQTPLSEETSQEKEMTVIIRPELKRIFDKDICRAALFNHMLYWIARKQKQGEPYWYATGEQLHKQLCETWGITYVRRATNTLVDKHLIGETKNPKWGVDRTKHFYFAVEHAQAFYTTCLDHATCPLCISFHQDVMEMLFSHLITLSKASDTCIKCLCETHFTAFASFILHAFDNPDKCIYQDYQMHLIQVSKPIDKSIKAITKGTTKGINKGVSNPTGESRGESAERGTTVDGLTSVNAHTPLQEPAYLPGSGDTADVNRRLASSDTGQVAAASEEEEIDHAVVDMAPADSGDSKHSGSHLRPGGEAVRAVLDATQAQQVASKQKGQKDDTSDSHNSDTTRHSSGNTSSAAHQGSKLVGDEQILHAQVQASSEAAHQRQRLDPPSREQGEAAASPALPASGTASSDTPLALEAPIATATEAHVGHGASAGSAVAGTDRLRGSPPASPAGAEPVPSQGENMSYPLVPSDPNKPLTPPRPDKRAENSALPPGKDTNTKRAGSKPQKPIPIRSKAEEIVFTEDGRVLFDEWCSIFKVPVAPTKANIKAANWLASPCAIWAEVLGLSRTDVLRDMRGWEYANDRNGYFKGKDGKPGRGVKLFDLERDFEGWQSAKEAVLTPETTGVLDDGKIIQWKGRMMSEEEAARNGYLGGWERYKGQIAEDGRHELEHMYEESVARGLM